VPTLRGTGIRVQTVVVAARQWEMTPTHITAEYGLTEAQVDETLAFYEAHHAEIDAAIATEQAMEEAKKTHSETQAEDWTDQVRWLSQWR
jgi:uncharacterized protein (DUF433 family)